MRILSTQVNHLWYGYSSTDAALTMTICKCPQGIVWEIHNLVIRKLSGGVSAFASLQINRNGIRHHVDALLEIAFVATAVHVRNDMFYLASGDQLELTVSAWIDYLEFDVSWGVVEHRD